MLYVLWVLLWQVPYKVCNNAISDGFFAKLSVICRKHCSAPELVPFQCSKESSLSGVTNKNIPMNKAFQQASRKFRIQDIKQQRDIKERTEL